MSNATDLETNYKGMILAVKSIPALPIALQRAMALMDGPRTNIAKIGEVIAQDQSLTARVLKMVNSPIYGFPRRIASIHNALVLLGVNAVHGLLISSVVFDIVSRHMAGLWGHSVACSTACKIIAKHLNFKDEEECMLAGLLHDFGKVVISLQLPDALRDIVSLVRNEDISFYEAEKLILGFGHTRVNTWMASHWNLPLGISEAISYHHNPLASENYKSIASVVHLGNFFARVFEMGHPGDTNVSDVSPHTLKYLGLDQGDLREIVDKIGIAFTNKSSFPIFGR